MAFREVIHLLIDLDSSGATSNVGRLRAELGNTEGAFNKLRVGAAGAFDIVKQHALMAGTAAAAAIAAFAVDAIGDFQKTALGAGQLASSLGVTTEEASRLQEVAVDLGIGVSTVEKGIGRMNREIANSPEKFDAIGAAIARNRDGTVNVTQTFLNVVDALNKIPDPTRRAAAAQEILGRGWQDMSRLITMGADGVAAALQDVESAKIMTPAQVRQAEQFRDTMDELRGIGESVSIVVGSELVDAFNDLATVADSLKGPIKEVRDELERFEDVPGFDQLASKIKAVVMPAGLLREGLDRVATALDAVTGSSEITASVWDTGTDAATGLDDATADLDDTLRTNLDTIKLVAEAQGRANESARLAKDRLDAQRQAQQALRDEMLRAVGTTFDYERANLQLTTGMRAFEQAVSSGERSAEELRLEEIALAGQALSTAEAFAAEQRASGNAASAADLQRFALIRLQGQFPALHDEIQAYINRLNAIPRSVTTNIVTRQSTVTASGAPARNFIKPEERASGGPVRAGEPYLVGEAGVPELFVPDQNGTVVPPGRGGSVAGTGSTVNVTINMPPGTNGNDVVRAIRRYEKYNGTGWRAS